MSLKDWPPTKLFALIFPHMFEIFEMVLTGPVLTSRKGALNMESSMPEGSCPPDTGAPITASSHACRPLTPYLGPKAYLAHGTVKGATTRLHCDMTDAVNILFYAEPLNDDEEGGAEWTMIDRGDMAKAEDLLRKWKGDCFEGHPIHSQEIILTPEDVTKLREHGVHVWVFTQRQGDAVFIPAGVGHQVSRRSFIIV